MIDPSQISMEQIMQMFAALSAANDSQHPTMAQLVAKAERLAKGLEKPPPNRGFKKSDNEEPEEYDQDNTTVFVGGITPRVTESILAQLFAPFGPTLDVSNTSSA